MTHYRTIVADPPWPISWPTGGKTDAGTTCRAKKRLFDKRPLPYTTMSIEDIAALRVADLAEDDAHLFLWTMDGYVLDGSAARVCRAWGFEPLPRMLVWHKRSAGLGGVFRSAHELIVIGRRGNAKLGKNSIRTVQEWRQVYENGAKKHSAKPDGSYDEIERLSEGPYLDLFSRRARLGWDTWGDEALGGLDLTEGVRV